MSERGFIRPRTEGGLGTERGAVLSARGLPPDLLRDASRRLAITSGLVALAFLIALIVNSVARAGGWYVHPQSQARDLIAVAMILVSVTILGLSRSGWLDAPLLLDIGLFYEVVVAFGISMGDNLMPLSTDRPLEAISWVCVWIVIYPFITPATRAKTMITAFAAATMWPLAFVIGVFILAHPIPDTRFVAMNFLENYIAAAAAFVPALVIEKLGADVQKARRMGSYELVERLESGGMGDVWRARHRMLARPAAIKLIRRDALGAREGREAELLLRRFEREAQATAALHSPHTIVLYDYGVTEDGTFYYVMELLEGLDLEGLVKRFGPVPAERAVHFLLQACDSLADAHASGLIHRDVKPANIYACRLGRAHDFVKILDFGLVKPSWGEEQQFDARLTREGTVSGTPAYMAPEVILGKREIDGRVDLYALGCVAYWLLTGQLVFTGETAMEIALHHAHTVPVPPSRRTDLPVPASLERLILACLEKEPDKRPATAEEIARELSRSACEIGEAWTQERARRWWEAHRPSPVPRPPQELSPDLDTPSI